MSATFLVTSRETLEAALIVSIMLAFLRKTKNVKHRKFVWYGVAAGIVVSIMLAYIFEKFLGGFSGRAEELYEGTAMLLAAALITWMILWLISKRHTLRHNLENKMETHLKKDHPFGIFLLSFVGTAREGIETVIFLQALTINASAKTDFLGGILGIFFAVAIGFLFYRGMKTFALKHFFTFTSTLLILFAAGLVAHGVHELQEAGVISIFSEQLWDINHFLNENGKIGIFLKGLFGYNGNPSLLEVISYLGYLTLITAIWFSLNSGTKEKVPSTPE